MLTEASCSIPCSECDVSRSLGFKALFAPHFSVLSYVWVGFASRLWLSSVKDLVYSRRERAFSLLFLIGFQVSLVSQDSTVLLRVCTQKSALFSDLRTSWRVRLLRKVGSHRRIWEFARLQRTARKVSGLRKVESLRRKARCSRLYGQLVGNRCFTKSNRVIDFEMWYVCSEKIARKCLFALFFSSLWQGLIVSPTHVHPTSW
jgi:hypothetical protein